MDVRWNLSARLWAVLSPVGCRSAIVAGLGIGTLLGLSVRWRGLIDVARLALGRILLLSSIAALLGILLIWTTLWVSASLILIHGVSRALEHEVGKGEGGWMDPAMG